MPRSTLACPPAKNFTDQLKNTNTQSQARLSSQVRQDNGESEKNRLRNDSSEKNFGFKASNLKNDNFGSSANNFRPSSK
jgi:hypothetical protein